MPDKLIIDTDIGTDVDDAIALTYAIRSGIDIPLITTVHGNTTIRARIARKLVSLLGKDIPVVAGAEKPLKQPGQEGKVMDFWRVLMQTIFPQIVSMLWSNVSIPTEIR